MSSSGIIRSTEYTDLEFAGRGGAGRGAADLPRWAVPSMQMPLTR